MQVSLFFIKAMSEFSIFGLIAIITVAASMTPTCQLECPFA